MREIDKYGVLKEKLKNLCDEHDLIYEIKNDGYPFRMMIKPAGGMDSQQTMLEGMENPGETGYISPDASMTFVCKDGELSYKISETWTISATLFNKFKNLFTKLCNMWMSHFFRDIHEHNPSMAAVADAADPVEEAPDFPVDEDGAFDEFLTEAEPATDGEE